MSECNSTDNVDDFECNSNNKNTQTPNDIRNIDLEKESVEYLNVNTKEQNLSLFSWKEMMVYYPMYFFRRIWGVLPSLSWKFSWYSKSS